MPATAARAASFHVGLRSPAMSGSAMSGPAAGARRSARGTSTSGNTLAIQRSTLPPFESAPPATTLDASRWYVHPPVIVGGSSVAYTTRIAPDVPRKSDAVSRPTAPAPTFEHAPSPTAGTHIALAMAGQRRAKAGSIVVSGASSIGESI